MVGNQDPVVQRRRLRLELRRLRREADISQRDVARAMDWSVSKLIRIENGEVGISSNDLRMLLQHYQVFDVDRVNELVALAKGARKESWSEFRDLFAAPFLAYLGYESSAWLIRQFELSLVPGLLQIEEYTSALLKGMNLSNEVIERIWLSRLRRQEVHDRSPNPPSMFFVLDEAVIQRLVGGPGVMRRQLQRLHELTRMDHVHLRIIPFSIGAHRGQTGPFVLLEFDDPADDMLLFMELPTGDLVSREDPPDTSRHFETFFELEDLALSEEDSREVLAETIRKLAHSDPQQPSSGSSSASSGAETKMKAKTRTKTKTKAE